MLREKFCFEVSFQSDIVNQNPTLLIHLQPRSSSHLTSLLNDIVFAVCEAWKTLKLFRALVRF